jgi:hypothetical protein
MPHRTPIGSARYILELAAANEQYLKFRNAQLPEVMDAAATPTLRFISNFFKASGRI